MNRYKIEFILKHKEGGQISRQSLSWILEEINRDRSDEWIDYTADDFVEGLEYWTDYKLLGVSS